MGAVGSFAFAALRLLSSHASGPIGFLSDLEWEWYVMAVAATTGGTALVYDRRAVALQRERLARTAPVTAPSPQPAVSSEQQKWIEAHIIRLDNRIDDIRESLDGEAKRISMNLLALNSRLSHLEDARSREPLKPAADDGLRSTLRELLLEGELLLDRCPEWDSEEPAQDLFELTNAWLGRAAEALADRPHLGAILNASVPYAFNDHKNYLWTRITTARNALERILADLPSPPIDYFGEEPF